MKYNKSFWRLPKVLLKNYLRYCKLPNWKDCIAVFYSANNFEQSSTEKKCLPIVTANMEANFFWLVIILNWSFTKVGNNSTQKNLLYKGCLKIWKIKYFSNLWLVEMLVTNSMLPGSDDILS